jgi:hypothetical protein
MQIMIGSFARMFLELMTPTHFLNMTEQAIRRLEQQVHSTGESNESA